MKIFEGFTLRGVVDVARRELAERPRTQLLRVVLMLSSFVVVGLLALWITKGALDYDDAATVTPYLQREATRMFLMIIGVSSYFLVGLFSMLSASLMFPELAAKDRRIHFFMIPQSMADKFWGRFAVYVVLFAVSLILCMVVAFILVWGVGQILCPDLLLLSAAIKMVFNILDSNDVLNVILPPLLAFLLANCSFFVVGSVAFPRYSFIKTYVALMILQIALQTAAVPLISVVLEGDLTLKATGAAWLSGTATFMLLLLMVGNWIAASYWLKKSDVID